MQKNFSTDKVLKLGAIIPVIGVIIYTLLLFFLLIWPNFKGFGDNGDFARMMEWGGIDYQTNDYSLKYWHNVNRFFNLIPLKNSPKEKFVSSELLFLYPSIWINRFFYDGKYDLAVLGFLHIIAAAIAIFLILSFFSKIKWQYSLIILLPVLMFFSDFGTLDF